MIDTRYHGYPMPDLDVSEVMRSLADGRLSIVHMADTFEPFLLDEHSRHRYAMPSEVDSLISLICSENMKYRQERLRNEQRV